MGAYLKYRKRRSPPNVEALRDSWQWLLGGILEAVRLALVLIEILRAK